MSHLMTRNLVEGILRNPIGLPWTVQGLGMMRMYLTADRSVRLHVWDRALVVPGASPVHTHPWDFSSYVVAGRVFNQRFGVAADDSITAYEWNRARLKCGTGAHIVATLEDHVDGGVERVRLVEWAVETWSEEATYFQSKDEIHRSMPEDGTVTIVTRTFGADPDHAWVFWRGAPGTAWGSAEPREARPEEVMAVTERALRTWW